MKVEDGILFGHWVGQDEDEQQGGEVSDWFGIKIV